MAFTAKNVETVGLCRCGCGNQTKLALHDSPERGHVKGQPLPFLKGHFNRGRGTGWSWDKSKNRMFVVTRDWKRVPWSRVVVENAIGRPLRSDEHVHHVNGDKSDDRIENLKILPRQEHMRLHALERPRGGGGYRFASVSSSP